MNFARGPAGPAHKGAGDVFSGSDRKTQRILGRQGMSHTYRDTTSRWAPGHSIRPPSSGSWARSRGSVAYVEPSRRPTDGRYGDNPNRLQHYYQYQVILKPSPVDVQDLYLDSLRHLGIKLEEHDVRFVEDDWESPTLGAAGLGWEVWLDGMEITQFTYFQQCGSIDLSPIIGGADLRPRAHLHVPAGRQPFHGRYMWNENVQLRRRSPPERIRVFPLQFQHRGHRAPFQAL